MILRCMSLFHKNLFKAIFQQRKPSNTSSYFWQTIHHKCIVFRFDHFFLTTSFTLSIPSVCRNRICFIPALFIIELLGILERFLPSVAIGRRQYLTRNDKGKLWLIQTTERENKTRKDWRNHVHKIYDLLNLQVQGFSLL